MLTPAIATMTMVCLSVSVPVAQAVELKVLCSNGVRAALEDLRPQFEHASGHTLAIEYSTTATLKQRIQAGAAFDVTILTDEAVDDLVAAGLLTSSLRAELARVGIGVGFRKGAAKPDVRTPASIKHALTTARSVAYTRDGASRPAVDRMLARLGITQAVEARAHLTEAGQAPESVAKGESDLVMTLISEILSVANIELAGPLPAEFQSYLSFAATAQASTANTQAVHALIAFLDGPAAAGTYEAKGMQPL